MDNIPPGGSLIVSNHSGGMVTLDLSVFATDFYDKFGYDRPLYALGHDSLFVGPAAEFFRAHRGHPRDMRQRCEGAGSRRTCAGFPGDYDAYRPSVQENVIGFGGRTGYVTTAIEAGVPIVPVVSIGGQENQLYLTRGRRLARALGLSNLGKKLFRSDMLPVTFGFPFGFSVLFPVNMPLPTKIVDQCCTRSTSPPSSATTPTSTRSTRMCARSCRTR